MLLDSKPLTPAIGEHLTPSARLLELCRAYLAMVDEPDSHTSTPERNAERTAAHDALIEQMRAEDFIGTPNRVQVRWLARYFAQTDFLQTHRIAPREGRTLLFWRVNSEPLYPKLEAFPPFDEHEERAALALYKPVWVKVNEVIDAARRYVAAIERTAETGKARHDEKRQLAHDDLMHALLQLNPGMNPNDFDDNRCLSERIHASIRVGNSVRSGDRRQGVRNERRAD